MASTLSAKFFQGGVDPLLDEIGDKADELRALYERINYRLKEVESALNAAAPGVFAWTRDGKFGYGKDLKSKRWGFLARNSRDEIVSVWEGGVSERIELSQCLEDLIQRIWLEMGGKAFRVRTAITQMEELLEALEACREKRSPSSKTSIDTTPESPDGS